jgi:DNA-binding response OmpR family regulator
MSTVRKSPQLVENRAKAHVLIVDDDPDTVFVLAHFVRREGFVAIEAGSGLEALRILSDRPVDVILLDLMMPGMDGFEVCRVLKRDPATAEIPVIMITARDDLEARAESIRLGISEFLTKPVLGNQLASRIRNQVEMRAASRATEAALDRVASVGAPPKN